MLFNNFEQRNNILRINTQINPSPQKPASQCFNDFNLEGKKALKKLQLNIVAAIVSSEILGVFSVALIYEAYKTYQNDINIAKDNLYKCMGWSK